MFVIHIYMVFYSFLLSIHYQAVFFGGQLEGMISWLASTTKTCACGVWMFPRKLQRYKVYSACRLWHWHMHHKNICILYLHLHISSKSHAIIIQVTIIHFNKPTNEPLPQRVRKHADLVAYTMKDHLVLCEKEPSSFSLDSRHLKFKSEAENILHSLNCYVWATN
jgi:hypothetical protein